MRKNAMEKQFRFSNKKKTIPCKWPFPLASPSLSSPSCWVFWIFVLSNLTRDTCVCHLSGAPTRSGSVGEAKEPSIQLLPVYRSRYGSDLILPLPARMDLRRGLFLSLSALSCTRVIWFGLAQGFCELLLSVWRKGCV
ncbi:hypothetical protein F2Q69_00004084 [Brassica cretica]|uniref:Uncharacterized protein n=1 Tax=Brassica cretica TaxID=69181 RepID=A0A8S9P156_BRACR|nr:hypothetical protein F2Q69_00004084 [Brassica cretica]